MSYTEKARMVGFGIGFFVSFLMTDLWKRRK